jgi:tryptophan synthase alpha chain
LPIGVGFGISTAAHVTAIGEHADGAIVGSALVTRLHEVHEDGGDVLDAAERFVTELRSGQ